MCVVALLLVLVNWESRPKTTSQPSNVPSSSAESENPQSASVVSAPQQATLDDHRLNLIPNFLGRGATSDGRIYSVAAIVPYMMSIPPTTKIFFQGVVTADMGANAVSIADEKDRSKILVCMMTPEGYQDLISQLRSSHSMTVNGFGDFDHAWALGPVFNNCEFSDPTDPDNVVRPLASRSTDSSAGVRSTTNGNSTNLDSTTSNEPSPENDNSTVAPIENKPPDSPPNN
jgi:hypothetical protein